MLSPKVKVTTFHNYEESAVNVTIEELTRRGIMSFNQNYDCPSIHNARDYGISQLQRQRYVNFTFVRQGHAITNKCK